MGRKESLPAELLGHRLHGGQLDEAGLAAWFADEAEFHADVAADYPMRGTATVNRLHAFRYFQRRQFMCCLALGAANGREYVALAGQVARIVAIEPARQFWRDAIAGVPAEYRVPNMDGKIDLPDAVCDLACSFGVLHHIANVPQVLAELARVMAPGAPLVIREPITSLGDFRAPRRGLSRNERGIPHRMMDEMLRVAGFSICHKRFCAFPGTREIPAWFGVSAPWESRILVFLDAWLSTLSAWNVRYWRPRLSDKLAPRMAYWVAVRN